MSRQDQAAGERSFQLQATGNIDLTVTQGVTTEVAIELLDAVAARAVAQYSALAREQALLSATSFAQALVKELVGANQLHILADPAFLHLLDKACLKAATTAEASEHDMLARLLADRAERHERRVVAAIDRAVEVVPLLDSQALSGLTVFAAVTQWGAASTLVSTGLAALEKLFGILLPDGLPSGAEWLDHLDSLDCIRIAGVGTGQGFVQWIEWFGNAHPCYAADGVPAGDVERIERDISLPPFAPADFLMPHDLVAGRWRAPFSDHRRAHKVLQALGNPPRLTEHVIDVVSREPLLSNATAEGKQRLAGELEKYPNLMRIQSWWNGIPETFRLTKVGTVIARSNVRQLDKEKYVPQDID